MQMNHEQLKAVARVHAQANQTDPFSYARILLHMKNGYVEPSEVLEDAFNALKSRGVKWEM